MNSFISGWGIDLTNAPGFKKATALQNMRSAQVTFARYATLASRIIKFEGVTDTCSDRVFREGFLWYPTVSIFKVGDNYVNLPSVPGGRGFNAQGEFGDGYAYAKNGQVYHINYKMPGEDETSFLARTPGPETPGEYRGVVLRANDMCYPLINTVIYYTEKIADMFAAIGNSSKLLKTPLLVQCDQKQRATFIKWYKELEANFPFIIMPRGSINNNASRSSISIEPFNVSANGDIIKPAVELIDWYDQRCLMELGIKNAGTQVDKKGENLTSDEVNSSDVVTNLVVDNMVNTINEQIERMGVHEMPGLENLKCVRGDINGASDIRGVLSEQSESLADQSAGDNQSING